jgi:hypothetical protein
VGLYWYNSTCHTISLQTVCSTTLQALVTGLTPTAGTLDGSGRLVVTLPAGTVVPTGYTKLAAYTSDAVSNGSDPIIITLVDYGGWG